LFDKEEGVWISARDETEARVKASERLGLPVDELHLEQGIK